MEQDKETQGWVDTKLAALDSVSNWRPDAGRALARVRNWNHERKHGRHAWLWASAAACASFLVLMVLMSPSACANPRGCGVGFWQTVFSKRVAGPVTPAVPEAGRPTETAPAPVTEAPPAAVPQAQKPAVTKPAAPAAGGTAKAAAKPLLKDYKAAGTFMAPITIEVYTDYECPHCALLYQEVIPTLMAQFVVTGKVRLVHRDFPLPQHQYARLAARYANAAGELGYYDAAVKQIFKTQAEWQKDGEIGQHLAEALPADVMVRVRDLVKNDSHLEETVDADLAMGHQDQLNQTPTMVIVVKGQRQALPGVPAYSMLKSYLDGLLSR
jgi:protein-disulfide isomerase